jgi:hypothetical protein
LLQQIIAFVVTNGGQRHEQTNAQSRQLFITVPSAPGEQHLLDLVSFQVVSMRPCHRTK